MGEEMDWYFFAYSLSTNLDLLYALHGGKVIPFVVDVYLFNALFMDSTNTAPKRDEENPLNLSFHIIFAKVS